MTHCPSCGRNIDVLFEANEADRDRLIRDLWAPGCDRNEMCILRQPEKVDE
jgi:hypothetical protein